jgi:excisionase family DNA binding protein
MRAHSGRQRRARGERLSTSYDQQLLEQMTVTLSLLGGLLAQIRDDVRALIRTTPVSRSTSGLLTVDEAAAYLGVHRVTLYRLRRLNGFTTVNIGRPIYFDRAELDRWIAAGRPGLRRR